jgi:phospholipid/cholesterol/gamma-HCH transport system permease protein
VSQTNEERESAPPPSVPPSQRVSILPPPEPGLRDRLSQVFEAVLEHFGHAGNMTWGALTSIFKRPSEIRATIYQMHALGVRSVPIASVTAVFVGMVMALQFAFGLQRFGGMEYTGRVVGISFTRELAPTLTAVIVGARMGAGIAAELGSMAVTEQIDAIRSLGADPLKKLVAPRLVASTIVMPMLCAIALVVGFGGAMFITSAEFGLPAGFFLRTALSSVNYIDYVSGTFKCPVYGAIIAIVGCHYGIRTRGGTEGVGHATTATVVTTSIAILIADFFMTKISFIIWPAK